MSCSFKLRNIKTILCLFLHRGSFPRVPAAGVGRDGDGAAAAVVVEAAAVVEVVVVAVEVVVVVVVAVVVVVVVVGAGGLRCLLPMRYSILVFCLLPPPLPPQSLFMVFCVSEHTCFYLFSLFIMYLFLKKNW